MEIALRQGPTEDEIKSATMEAIKYARFKYQHDDEYESIAIEAIGIAAGLWDVSLAPWPRFCRWRVKMSCLAYLRREHRRKFIERTRPAVMQHERPGIDIDEIIGRLPEELRAIARLRWFHGLKLKEIAEILGQDIGHTHGLLTKIVAKIEGLLR